MRTFEQYQEINKAVKAFLASNNIPQFKISATERQEFKECQRKWYFGSYNGLGIEPKRHCMPLWLGTGIHYGLERYYAHVEHPEQAFEKFWLEEAAKLENLSTEEQQAINDALLLGKTMLKGYESWVQKYDKNWVILGVEEEWEYILPKLIYVDGQLYAPTLVGKWDLVIWDNRNMAYYVVDHKTNCMRIDGTELEWNDQLPIYALAASRIFEKPFGVIWNNLRKKAPTIPKELKAGGLSRAKDIDTTYEVYLAEIERKGLNSEDYKEVLERLKTKNDFFERLERKFAPSTLDILEENIYQEATDMLLKVLKSRHIYPAPTQDCNWKCDYKDLCRASNIGADVQMLIERKYQKREQKGVYLNEGTKSGISTTVSADSPIATRVNSVENYL